MPLHAGVPAVLPETDPVATLNRRVVERPRPGRLGRRAGGPGRQRHCLADVGRAAASGRPGHDQAKAGLAQALTSLGGPRTAAGVAARDAYSSGLDLAMIVGALLVAAASVAVHRSLPAPGKAALPGKSAPTPAPSPDELVRA